MTQSQYKNYAQLIVFGVGAVRGKTVLIVTEKPGLELAAATAEECYRQGAGLVEYQFRDNSLKRARVLHADSIDSIAPWTSSLVNHMCDSAGVTIFIKGSEDDHLLSGLPPERAGQYARSQADAQSRLSALRIRFQVPWIIVLVPTREKARDAFPQLGEEEAFGKYEKAIVDVLQLDNDPLDFWQQSFETLARRRNRYNALNLEEIHFADDSGAIDLRIKLIPGGSWATAEQNLPGGSPVRVNIPSCEIYTSPHARGTEGRVKITMPFIPARIPGDVINGAWFEFREGRVVDYGSDSGKAALSPLIEMDEGASFLGEVALVDKNSAVAQQNMLFHNILYDENASCHIAIGQGFPSLVKGLENSTPEELMASGLNSSRQHQDMMIGSSTMTVRGIDTAGNSIPLIENGSFVE